MNDRPVHPTNGSPAADYSYLRALFINRTLKGSPRRSHTRGLMDTSKAILEANDVSVEVIRAVDHDIAPGVYPDMTEHGVERDEWPALQEKVMNADILVLGTPVWLGEKSAVCTRVVERLYGYSASSTTRASMSTTAGWPGASSPATRTG